MRFAEYLDGQKISDAEFARRLGVTRETIRRYREGSRTPDRDNMAKIVSETDGAVTANDFYAEQAAS